MAGRRKTHIPLDVYLNGRLVGRLRREAGGAIDFRYAEDWLSWESAFAVSLSLPLREDRYVGARVVAVFDNLLPDNDDIRRRLAARTGAGGIDAFSLLGAVGRDCGGALQFLPEGEAPPDQEAVSGRALSEGEVAAILGDLGQAPLGVTADWEFRISLAGAQEKTALLWWNNAWHIPHGATPTTHVLKPQIGKRGAVDLSASVENEYLCLKIAKAAGLPCANAQIAEFGGARALVVERFDRRWRKDGRLLRLPQEDCCQALSVPPPRKYEIDGGPGIVRLLELLKASDDPQADQRLFLKAQVLFWLLGATDGHAKNFSLHLLPGGRFRLAPLYDIMSTQPYVAARQLTKNQFRLAMAVGKNRHYNVEEIFPRHFEQSAAAAGVGAAMVADVMADLLRAMPRAFEEVARHLPDGFPGRLVETVGAGMHKRLRRMETQER
jgi:serine/threonine-protein kinase HipA